MRWKKGKHFEKSGERKEANGGRGEQLLEDKKGRGKDVERDGTGAQNNLLRVESSPHEVGSPGRTSEGVKSYVDEKKSDIKKVSTFKVICALMKKNFRDVRICLYRLVLSPSEVHNIPLP